MSTRRSAGIGVPRWTSQAPTWAITSRPPRMADLVVLVGDAVYAGQPVERLQRLGGHGQIQRSTRPSAARTGPSPRPHAAPPAPPGCPGRAPCPAHRDDAVGTAPRPRRARGSPAAPSYLRRGASPPPTRPRGGPTGSSPWVSSSRITSRGWLRSASTRNSRCCSPAAHPRERRPPLVREPELLEQRVAVLGPRPREELDGLGDPHPIRQRRALQLAAELRPEPVGVPDRVETEHAHVPGVGPPESLEDLDGRGLAGPVGADQAQHLARMDVEVEPVDDHPAAVRLGQPADGDDRIRGLSREWRCPLWS